MRSYGERESNSQDSKVHIQYDILATDGWSHDWVHCAICKSQNGGFSPDGTPIYTRGYINVITGKLKTITACRCAEGQRVAVKLGIPFFDTIADKIDKYDIDPLAILWIRGENDQDPPARIEMPKFYEYQTRMNEGMQKRLRNQISQEDFESACEKLTERLMPPKIPCPTIRDILASDAFMERYTNHKSIKKPTPVITTEDLKEAQYKDGE